MAPQKVPLRNGTIPKDAPIPQRYHATTKGREGPPAWSERVHRQVPLKAGGLRQEIFASPSMIHSSIERREGARGGLEARLKKSAGRLAQENLALPSFLRSGMITQYRQSALLRSQDQSSLPGTYSWLQVVSCRVPAAIADRAPSRVPHYQRG